jgi:hypothetical protein
MKKGNATIFSLGVLVIACGLFLMPLALVNAADTTSTPVTSGLITDLKVNDTAHANAWSVQSGLKVGDLLYGDRIYAVATLPTAYVGSTLIRTSPDSKKFTNAILATFKVTKDATVFVVIDDRVINVSKPAWLADWVDSGDDITDNEASPIKYSLFKKSFTANSEVQLGPNGATSGCSGYFAIVK